MSHTPGPWQWRINRSTKRIHLTGRGLTVMDFVRYGMNNAAPRFLDSEHLMQRADELAINIPGEGHHSHWNQDINHDDARLIAAAPDLLEVLKFALNESGCDGDLCCHDWHDKARKVISKAEGKD
jgi:hypothetical protein